MQSTLESERVTGRTKAGGIVERLASLIDEIQEIYSAKISLW